MLKRIMVLPSWFVKKHLDMKCTFFWGGLLYGRKWAGHRLEFSDTGNAFGASISRKITPRPLTVGQPGVGTNLEAVPAVLRFVGQTAKDQVHTALRDGIARRGGLVVFDGFGVVEERLASNEDREEDAQRPNLGRHGLVRSFSDQLRGSKIESTKETVQRLRLLTIVEQVSGAKVNQLHAVLIIDHNVFVLDVAMDEAIVVKTSDNIDELSKDILGMSLGEATVLLDAFKQIEEERRIMPGIGGGKERLLFLGSEPI